jgi:hypothetical protein
MDLKMIDTVLLVLYCSSSGSYIKWNKSYFIFTIRLPTSNFYLGHLITVKTQLYFSFLWKLKQYLLVVVNSQAEYNTINRTTTAQSSGQSAILRWKFAFPMTILTYNTSFNKQVVWWLHPIRLYTYMRYCSKQHGIVLRLNITLSINWWVMVKINCF